MTKAVIVCCKFEHVERYFSNIIEQSTSRLQLVAIFHMVFMYYVLSKYGWTRYVIISFIC